MTAAGEGRASARPRASRRLPLPVLRNETLKPSFRTAEGGSWGHSPSIAASRRLVGTLALHCRVQAARGDTRPPLPRPGGSWGHSPSNLRAAPSRETTELCFYLTIASHFVTTKPTAHCPLPTITYYFLPLTYYLLPIISPAGQGPEGAPYPSRRALCSITPVDVLRPTLPPPLRPRPQTTRASLPLHPRYIASGGACLFHAIPQHAERLHLAPPRVRPRCVCLPAGRPARCARRVFDT